MSKKLASNSIMSIEQMFEDIPNSSFSNTHDDSNDLTCDSTPGTRQASEASKNRGKSLGKNARQPGGRNKLIKSGSEFKPDDITGVFKTLVTSHVQPKTSTKTGSVIKAQQHTKSATIKNPPRKSDVLGESKSAEETGQRRGKRASASAQIDRMTPTTALAMFGKLVIHHLLITGFLFDQVIKAYDHKERTFVALKLVRNERIYLKQAREELRILQVLRKQDPNGFYNIVLIKEFFMFRNHMVIVFELLGMNLYQVISKNGGRGLPMMKIVPIARGILKCLELLFKNRLIHCDLKPENIMLRRNGDLGSIKVGDFGSSCYEQQQVYHYIQSRYYRAPEVILGMRYGPAIDMWSLGCVLAELSTGTPLFMGSNETDQLTAIEEMMGEMPKAMLSKSTKFKQGVSAARASGRSRGAPGTKELATELPGDETFKDLISKTLTLDPSQRPTPLELLEHPWLSKHRTQSSTSSNSRESNIKRGSKS
ncbi:dual specificity tyrosine-phosphorylation-regulated kinase 2-like protein [Elysia marginata]|uniref:Dual specificity tyrosine-phosphorylation-regulated kinase 2-like protein n=1 Tax=Elysia marginata TaxID=1093978 RepID=A0AAV4IGL8_9GAST|nr:dual specificity tyrosine-phosphorylation-regulated kinase 2-like protein [Elysia marginata]